MMKLSRNPFVWMLAATCLIWLPGCGGGDDKKTSSGSTTEGTETTSGTEGGDGKEEILLKPFDAPTLEELNAKVEWEDSPILDSLDLMRKRQAGEKVLATVEEASALKNNSVEANAKILSAMGRLPQSDSDVNWDAPIYRHARADVKSMNPLISSSSIEFDVVGLMSFGLIGFDWNFTPFASSDTVKSWQTSKDRMYDKFVIRDDLTWSDGKPITAHDIVFSFQTIMNPKVPVPAQRSGTDQIRWIEAYDDHTLVFFHKHALATNVWNLGFGIIPKHIYEESIKEDPTLQDSKYHVKYENAPVTGGPYVISKRLPKQEIVLTRRESYYMHNGKQVRQKPYFKEIRFRILEDMNTALLALKGGELDEIQLLPEQWTSQTDDDEFYQRNTKATGVEWVTFHFVWNVKTPFFADKRVRQAMSYAYDHDELLDKLLYGLFAPSTGIYHPDAWMASKEKLTPYKQNLDKAEELLDEAGWIDSDGDGIRDKEINGRKQKFEFTILTMNVKDRIDICALLKENLDQIGIVCHIKPLEFSVLMEKTRKHEFQAAFGGWGTGADPDTGENIWTTKAIKNGRNYGSYSNHKVDQLFEAGKREFDRDKRAAIYAEIHKILWDEQPYTWLYSRNSFFGFSKQLRGYIFSPRGPYGYGPGFSSVWKPAMH